MFWFRQLKCNSLLNLKYNDIDNMSFRCSYDESVIVISGILNSRAVMNASGCYELQLPAMRALTDKNGIQNVFLRTLQTIVKIREVLQANAKCIQIDVSIENITDPDELNAIEEYERKRLAEVRFVISILFLFSNSFHLATPKSPYVLLLLSGEFESGL